MRKLALGAVLFGLVAANANALFSWTMLLSITETGVNAPDHAPPASASIDRRTLASTSCWRVGPAEWM